MTPIPRLEPLAVHGNRTTGHYGVFCTDCNQPVEYADYTSHPCVVRFREKLAKEAKKPTTKKRFRFDPYWHHRDKETAR